MYDEDEMLIKVILCFIGWFLGGILIGKAFF